MTGGQDARENDGTCATGNTALTATIGHHARLAYFARLANCTKRFDDDHYD